MTYPPHDPYRAPQPNPCSYQGSSQPPGHFAPPAGHSPPQQMPRPGRGGGRAPWVIGGVATAVVAVVLAIAGLALLRSDPVPSTAADLPATSSNLPPLDMFRTDIRGADYSRQLDVVVPFLEDRRATSLAGIERYLPDPNQFDGDKKAAQELLNRFSADIQTAASQQNIYLGRNLLSGVYTDTAQSRESIGLQLGDGVQFVQRRLADAVSQHYSGGVIKLGTTTIEIDSDTFLINAIDQNDLSGAWNVYITQRQSQDGKYIVPVVLAEAKYGDRGFVMDVQNWKPRDS